MSHPDIYDPQINIRSFSAPDLPPHQRAVEMSLINSITAMVVGPLQERQHLQHIRQTRVLILEESPM